MVLSQRVTVTDIRVFNAMKEHVHATDTEHDIVKIKAVEHAVVEVMFQLLIMQDVRMALSQIFASGYEKSGCTACGITYNICWLWGCHLHHQANYVARGAELSILPGAGDFAKHVFVEVALGIAILHGHTVQKVNYPGQHRRGGNGETGTFHVVGVCGIVASQGAQKWKNVLINHCE